MENNNLSEEQQNARFLLRERYLYFLSALTGGKDIANIRLHENTQVTGTIKAVDLNCENILIKDLKTPHPDTIPQAILRTNDVIAIEVPYNADLLKLSS